MAVVVVIFGSTPCVEWPDMPCPMEAFGPYGTDDEARAVASSFPDAFRPHLLRVGPSEPYAPGGE